MLDSRPGRIDGDSARTLSRLAVTSQLGLAQLEAWLLRKGTALVRLQLRYSFLDLAKRAFGDETYQNIRRRILKGPVA